MSKFKLLALAGICSSLSVSAYASTSDAISNALATANAQIATWNSEAEAIRSAMTDTTFNAMVAYQQAVRDSESLGDAMAALQGSTAAGDLAALQAIATAQQTLITTLATEAADVQAELDKYQQITDRQASIIATTLLVQTPLQQALVAQNDKVQTHHSLLEREEILDHLKLQSKGLWVNTFQTHLSNSYTSSRNAVIALGYGHEFNPNVTAGGYITKYYPHLSNKSSGMSTSYKNGYGVGLYGLVDFGNYTAATIIDYKHINRSEDCLCQSYSQNSYGALFDVAYKGFADTYDLTPSVQYQYNRTTGGVTNFNVHQLGLNVSGQFIIRPTTRIKASLGLAGVYGTNPSSLYKLTTVDIRTYAGDLNQYAEEPGNTGFATPYEFTTVTTAGGKKKNEFDSKVSLHVTLEHQLAKQTFVKASVGYNAFLRSKLHGASYGVALNHRF
ncbi:hypothetical protein [Basilea psittacipulmonis]|uniref:Autotransporter domain-containing protein n=1 Tax=Basilea psittacipulmonis DSM 24701 TaxID=1072685 RepID=A0A077DC42_9BURK|nr:hypothetical protein [Basilea psittacipulmonis]AIL32214.1 hypothetical protein IX83_01805 [Basilea psittacipulmonis DSM 24701]